jgi:rubrerythrin
MTNITVEKAFDAAIGAERAAEQFFHGLAAKFSHDQEVFELWKQYAVDESKHAEWLETLKAKLGKKRAG